MLSAFCECCVFVGKFPATHPHINEHHHLTTATHRLQEEIDKLKKGSGDGEGGRGRGRGRGRNRRNTVARNTPSSSHKPTPPRGGPSAAYRSQRDRNRPKMVDSACQTDSHDGRGGGAGGGGGARFRSRITDYLRDEGKVSGVVLLCCLLFVGTESELM